MFADNVFHGDGGAGDGDEDEFLLDEELMKIERGGEEDVDFDFDVDDEEFEFEMDFDLSDESFDEEA